jgi:hypothetical protein
MINTEKSELHKKATITRDAAMLLLLGPLRDAVSWAFEEIGEPTAAESGERRSVCVKKELI